MNLTEYDGLPFVSITILFRGRELTLDKVLLDTGSASTLLNSDTVQEIGIVPEENDTVDIIRGVGGVEYVYTKYLDAIIVEEARLTDFQVELGNMDYGMEIEGILGFNFLKQIGGVIDVQAMELKTHS